MELFEEQRSEEHGDAQTNSGILIRSIAFIQQRLSDIFCEPPYRDVEREYDSVETLEQLEKYCDGVRKWMEEKRSTLRC